MPPPKKIRVGFVVKRYPRYSETFIVREILAHERAGLAIEGGRSTCTSRPHCVCGLVSAQIKRLGLRGRVEMMGPRPQGEIIQAVQNAAVLAAPCIIGKDGDRDGLPNVSQEALALGTPVISTDVTGIPEVVRDGDTGLLVPQHDRPALARALERLLGDGDLRVRLATAARRLLEAEFDIRRNTERRRTIFRAAARRRPEALQETA